MRLFLLVRKDVALDEHSSALIRAESEANARKMAQENLQSPQGAWEKGQASCSVVKEHGYPVVILSEFVRG